MPEGLDFIECLDNQSIEWIFSIGQERIVESGDVIIAEGTIPQSIIIVQIGSARVTNFANGNESIAVIGPGEILGEMSFIDEQPASATVTALETTHLFELPRKTLRQKIKSDSDFAVVFYSAVAKVMAERIRKHIATESIKIDEQSSPSSEIEEFWDRARGELRAFKANLHEADQTAIKEGEVPGALIDKVKEQFRAFSQGINRLIGDDSPLYRHVRDSIGVQLQREILPYILLTNIGERCYSKPRGYAGDFLTIQKMYENEETGTGRIGALLDRCFLDSNAAKAVQNRRALLSGEIKNTLLEVTDDKVHVTSLACGPASELFDVFGEADDAKRLYADVIDIDLQALAFVVDKRDRLSLQRRITPHNGNLLYLATGKQKLDLAPQHLIYSIGLIDYFSDKFVIKLMNYAHGLLKPGGRIILGNFHPSNTDKAYLDYILEWKLIHRSENDMDELFKKSLFGKPADSIKFEDEGINLFATCVREA